MYDIINIYLPIAEVNLNIFLIIAIGVGVGILAGIFGIGGGLILVPILVAIGVPSQVAVATSTNQMTAASFSGFLAYARRKRVDYKLGLLMLVGGLAGATFGVMVFDALTDLGMIDIFISLSFLVLLGIIGFTTSRDALTLLYYKFKKLERPKPHPKKWFKNFSLPFKINFISTRQEMSVLSPILVGLVGGFLVAIMGIGGSLIMLPAMIYLLRVSEAFTAGTTHFQIIFTTILATVLHSVTSHNLDIVLSTILIIGTAFGVQIGARLGSKWNPDNYRLLFALIIFILCVRVACGLVVTPQSLYTVEHLIK